MKAENPQLKASASRTGASIGWHVTGPMSADCEPRIAATAVMAMVMRTLGLLGLVGGVLLMFAQQHVVYLAVGLGALVGCLVLAEGLFLLHAIAVDTRVMRRRAEKKDVDSRAGGG